MIRTCVNSLKQGVSYSPFERTNLSRLKYLGFSGEYLIIYFHKATPMTAIPIAPL